MWLDDQEVTLGTMPATQRYVDEIFGTSYWTSSVFLTHASMHALLDASDGALRRVLGQIVDLDVWEDARRRVQVVGKIKAETAMRRAGAAQVYIYIYITPTPTYLPARRSIQIDLHSDRSTFR